MYNPQEASASIKSYLLKLKKIMNNEVTFNFGRIKIINKTKIDDMLCCVEGSFPQEYRKYLNKYGANRLKSKFYMNQLHAAIENKFLFSTKSYAVNVLQAEGMIAAIISVLESDLRRVAEDQ